MAERGENGNSKSTAFARSSGHDVHRSRPERSPPRSQIKKWLDASFLIGGEGGITNYIPVVCPSGRPSAVPIRSIRIGRTGIITGGLKPGHNRLITEAQSLRY